MKETFQVILFLLVTALCIFFPYQWASKANRTQQSTVGPHLTESLMLGSTVSSQNDSGFTFQSDNYFELHQGSSVTQSILEDPEVGVATGKYRVRDYQISEQTEVFNSYAEVYHPQTEVSITYIPSATEKFLNGLLSFLGGFVMWVVGLMFVDWLTKLIFD